MTGFEHKSEPRRVSEHQFLFTATTKVSEGSLLEKKARVHCKCAPLPHPHDYRYIYIILHIMYILFLIIMSFTARCCAYDDQGTGGGYVE